MERLFCHNCRRLGPNVDSTPYEIELEAIEPGPLMLLGFRTGLFLYHRRFLDQLEPYCKNIAIGTVRYKGRAHPEYVTINCKPIFTEHNNEETA